MGVGEAGRHLCSLRVEEEGYAVCRGAGQRRLDHAALQNRGRAWVGLQ